MHFYRNNSDFAINNDGCFIFFALFFIAVDYGLMEESHFYGVPKDAIERYNRISQINPS
jgi:hypothetical protein